MAKAGKKRQNKAQVPESKKAKHAAEIVRKEDREIGNDLDRELEEQEAMLDEFEQQTRSSALEEAIREMKQASDNEDSDAMSEDDVLSDSEKEEEEDEEEEKEEQDERIEDVEPDKPAGKPTFRSHYMAKVTQAFGTDLDTIRQDPSFNPSQLKLLIDSLEAGIDIFSDLEQEIIMQQE